ncbi:hypothetical protein EBR57_01240 [bacterium]|nr:hypothetical protein [bacterium]
MTAHFSTQFFKRVATRRRNPGMRKLESIQLSPIQSPPDGLPIDSPFVTTRRPDKRNAQTAELELSPIGFSSDSEVAPPSPPTEDNRNITYRRSQRTKPIIEPDTDELNPKRPKIAQQDDHSRQIEVRLSEFTAAVVAIVGTKIDPPVTKNALEMVTRFGDLHLSITPDTPAPISNTYKSSLVALYKWAQYDRQLGSAIRKKIADIDPSVKVECARGPVQILLDSLVGAL